MRSIPMILQPFLGIIIERFSRVKIMFWTDIIRGFIFLSVTWLPKGEYPSLLFLLLLLSYGSGVFFNPARLAVMSLLGDDIKKLNTIFSKATTLCIIAGALIGAGFLALGSVKLAVVFNALTYFNSLFFISRMKIGSEANLKHHHINIVDSFMLGMKEIRHNQFVLNAVITMMTMSLLGGVVYSYFPIVSEYWAKAKSATLSLTSR